MAISNALIAYFAEEAAFEFAAQDILQREGPISDVRISGDQRALPDTICGVKFRKGVTVNPDVRGLRPGTGKRQEYSTFRGALEVKYGLLRTANVASAIVGCNTILDEKIGIIRACFLRSSQFFNADRLKNHRIDDIIELSATYGVDNTNNRERDFAILLFEIQYERIMANMPPAP